MAFHRGLTCAAAALACAASACAAEEARWYVQHDNDFFFDTDRWYSSGVRIARVDGPVEFGLLQEIYEPDAKNPAPVDRAPAARLLGYGAYHWRDDDAWQTAEIALGTRGPAALGRQATDLAHHLVTAHAVDWSRQLPSRFDAQAAVVRTQTLIGGLKAHVGAVVGDEITFAHAGLELRCGDAPSMASELLRYVATPPWPSDAARGWNTYAGASVRLVARNDLLGRAYVAGAPAPTMRHAVGRAVIGAAWTGARATIDISLAHETREFDEQRHPQHFGSIAIHVPF